MAPAAMYRTRRTRHPRTSRTRPPRASTTSRAGASKLPSRAGRGVAADASRHRTSRAAPVISAWLISAPRSRRPHLDASLGASLSLPISPRLISSRRRGGLTLPSGAAAPTPLSFAAPLARWVSALVGMGSAPTDDVALRLALLMCRFTRTSRATRARASLGDASDHTCAARAAFPAVIARAILVAPVRETMAARAAPRDDEAHGSVTG